MKAVQKQSMLGWICRRGMC